MSRIYYAVRYRLDHKECYLIWHSMMYSEADGSSEANENREADGVVIDQVGMIPVFRNVDSLLAYGQVHRLSPIEVDEPEFINLDAVLRWLKRKRPAQLDCTLFLNVWNLLDDISATIDGNFDAERDRTQRINAKLFWGTNILSPEGKHYTPMWSGRESQIIREVLRKGLAMFRSHIVLQRGG